MKKLSIQGMLKSSWSTSLVHLLIITPIGVVSKKFIGLLIIFHNIRLNMFMVASYATNPKASALKHKNIKVATPNKIYKVV